MQKGDPTRFPHTKAHAWIAIASNKHKKTKENAKEHRDPAGILVEMNFICTNTIVISSKQKKEKNKDICMRRDRSRFSGT